MLQFWIKFAWTVLAVTSGFALLIAMIGFRFGLGISWFQRHGNVATAPFFVMFVFSASMLLIEYVRDSYARFAPAKPYDVALAAAIAVTFSVLTLST